MLPTEKLQDIEVLQKHCESHDGIKLKLNWDMLRTRNEQETEDFFEYDDTKLIGFIGIYGFGDKVEICGMVHPEYRNQGVFTRLFLKAMEACHEKQYARILLNAPADSDSAKNFLQKIPCSYLISEYQMKYNQKPVQVSNDIVLRKASTIEDNLATIQLDMLCFGMSEEAATSFNKLVGEEGSYYIIEVDGKTVGKIPVYRENDESWIYSFAVYPEYQGKGIGRKALSNIAYTESATGNDIFLEVEVKNEHALGLYESCGFERFQTQDYYLYKGEKR